MTPLDELQEFSHHFEVLSGAQSMLRLSLAVSDVSKLRADRIDLLVGPPGAIENQIVHIARRMLDLGPAYLEALTVYRAQAIGVNSDAIDSAIDNCTNQMAMAERLIATLAPEEVDP